MARSRFGSAPMPSGKRLATMTKNRSAVATSLRRRSASSRSRWTSVRATASISGAGAQVEHTRVANTRVLMRRVDHGAAAVHLFSHEAIENRDAFGVEGGKRLVQEPQRRLGHEQARERRAPALTLRELAHRQLRYAEPLERRGERFHAAILAGKATADLEVLARREIVLHRGCVADVDELARVVLSEAADGLALPAHLAGARPGEAAQDPQEARLAAAVRAGDAQQLAPEHDGPDPAKQDPCAAFAFELRRLQHAGSLVASLGPRLADQLRSSEWRLSAESGTYLRTFSWVPSSTTRGARPASQASTQRSTCRHQRSPCFRPRKRRSGRGVTRSLPFATLNSRNASVTCTHTRWATPSWSCVAQQPSRK